MLAPWPLWTLTPSIKLDLRSFQEIDRRCLSKGAMWQVIATCSAWPFGKCKWKISCKGAYGGYREDLSPQQLLGLSVPLLPKLPDCRLLVLRDPGIHSSTGGGC